jgi:hypothetical protein
VHDLAALEAWNIPSVMVASSAFEGALRAQARALGTDPARVFVPHPIQDRTDAEMSAMAEAAAKQIVDALTRDAAA